jgi:hypothetical protein
MVPGTGTSEGRIVSEAFGAIGCLKPSHACPKAWKDLAIGIHKQGDFHVTEALAHLAKQALPSWSMFVGVSLKEEGTEPGTEPGMSRGALCNKPCLICSMHVRTA